MSGLSCLESGSGAPGLFLLTPSYILEGVGQGRRNFARFDKYMPLREKMKSNKSMPLRLGQVLATPGSSQIKQQLDLQSFPGSTNRWR